MRTPTSAYHLTQFAAFQFTREELDELHQALLQRALLEDELRRERGQEPVARRPLLEKFEILLNHTEDSLQKLHQEFEEDLWEYAWYAFTEEWAHFRAHQDAEREAKRARRLMAQNEVNTRAHQLYQKRFDEYVAEISMTEPAPSHQARSGKAHQGSRPVSA